MPSLGKAAKRVLMKGANDGAGKTIIADVKSAKGSKLADEAKPKRTEYENDNRLDPAEGMKMADAESKKIMRLLELADEGDLFALNKFAKKEFGMSWTKLKNDPAIKDML